METDDEKYQRGLSGQGAPDYLSAAWRDGDLERKKQQYAKSTASSDSDHSLLGNISGIILGVLCAIPGGLSLFGILGGVIGFIIGKIVVDALVHSRLVRTIFDAIVIIIILYLLLLAVLMSLFSGMAFY
jgi:hypothetical protein